MRFRSSAGNLFSHRTFGTTPNIAPPSRRKPEPLTMSSSRDPYLTMGSCQIPRCARDDDGKVARMTMGSREAPLLRHEGLRRRVVGRARRAFRVHGRGGGVPTGARL